jgi:PadR family transcriptional regulator PadR
MISGKQPKMTLPTQLVLRTLLEEPSRARYGLEISYSAGLPSGTIHPILARLEAAGWLESQWEDIDPRELGRPRRRYYSLSSEGIEFARDALARAYNPARTRLSGLPGLASGGTG